MNPSDLALIGAFDALAALIQNEREIFCKSFDPEVAIKTLKKARSNYVESLLHCTRAQIVAGETFRSTSDQLIGVLPQGSDTEQVVRSLQQAVVHYLPQGPTPPWPSIKCSRSTLSLNIPDEISQLISGLRSVIERHGPKG